MRTLTTGHQMFGDINKYLNNIRAKMSREVVEKCNKVLENKRNKDLVS